MADAFYDDFVQDDERIRGDQTDPWKQAEEAGLDMSLVEANLRRTPLERVRAHGRALATALALRAAVESVKKDHAGT